MIKFDILYNVYSLEFEVSVQTHNLIINLY